MLFFVETAGVAVEVSLALGGGASITSTPGASATTEGDVTVLRSIKSGTSAFAVLSVGSSAVQLVLLPAGFADRVFKIAESGRVLVAGNGGANGGLQTQPLMEEVGEKKGSVEVRTSLDSTELWSCPPCNPAREASTASSHSELMRPMHYPSLSRDRCVIFFPGIRIP